MVVLEMVEAVRVVEEDIGVQDEVLDGSGRGIRLRIPWIVGDEGRLYVFQFCGVIHGGGCCPAAFCWGSGEGGNRGTGMIRHARTGIRERRRSDTGNPSGALIPTENPG